MPQQFWGMFPGRGEGYRERGVREANNSSPAATVHLGLLTLSVVQETGWHQVLNVTNTLEEGHYIMSEPTHTVPSHHELK